MKVFINLGRGTLKGGCDTVIVQLLDSNNNCLRQFVGSLPPAPELAELYHRWQCNYRCYLQDRAIRIGLLEPDGFRYSETEFRWLCQIIPQKLNQWLDCQTFNMIERLLRTELSKKELIQFIFATESDLLRQLPWHLWNFISDYPSAVVGFSSPNWKETPERNKKSGNIRLLAILGNSNGIDVRADLDVLKNLREVELVILEEPRLSELNEHLWQTEGWDILLFSGHGQCDRGEGRINLNANEWIAVAELKHSLKKAIERGLQIAIFNSCEGTDLALKLADLSIPYTVVMREAVPDLIAQVFLKYLLLSFAETKSFVLAVREARQKLTGWDGEFMCASWLPLIFQNPTTNDLAWQDLQAERVTNTRPNLKQLWQTSMVTSLTIASLVIGVRSLGWLEPLELWAYDRLMQQRPAETIDPRILVVEITESDTNRHRYPLEDKTLVTAIDSIEQHQPTAIGLDIHRPYARGEGYQDLVRRFENISNLFPVCAYGSQSNSYASPNLPPEKLREQMGFSDLLIDNIKPKTTGNRTDLSKVVVESTQSPKVRRQLLSYEPSLAERSSYCSTPYSLSFQLAFEYLHSVGIEPLIVNDNQQWQFGEVVFQEMTRRFGGYQKLEAKSSQIPINYRSRQPGQRTTLTEILTGQVTAEQIKDRIVLIGYTATVARDYFDTPYGMMPGVWIHAHMTSQMISAVQDGRSQIWVLPLWNDWLWIVIWSVAFVHIAIFIAQKPSLYSILTLSIAIVIFHYICLFFLIRGGWLPYIPVIFVFLLATAIILVLFSSSSNKTIKKGAKQ